MRPRDPLVRLSALVFMLSGAVLFNACTPPLVVDYQPFQHRVFQSRKVPARRHKGPTKELLLGGYLLIGYINVRQNIRNCWETGRCGDILKGGPSDKQLAEAAAERGGDVTTWLQGETNLERTSYSYCASYTYTTITVNNKTSLIKVCGSTAQVKGFREYRVDRALIWRLEPELATAEANQKAIEKAMDRMVHDTEANPHHKAPAVKPSITQPFAAHPPEMKTRLDSIVDNQAVRQMAKAIQDGDEAAIRRLAAGPAVNAWRDNKGRSLLMLAMAMRRNRAVNAMIEGGFKWQTIDQDGNAACEYLAALGDTDNLKTAIKFGGSLKFKSKNGGNLLFTAVLNSDGKVLSWLLEQGVHPRRRDVQGVSALMVAAHYGKIEAAGMLIEHKARVRGTDNKGRTPLMIAASAGQVDMVELLASKGARLNARDKYGNTALIYAAANGRNAAIDRLESLGARLGARNKEGFNFFAAAWATKNWDTVNHLLGKQLIIKGIRDHGLEYLRLAIDANNRDVMRTLLHILRPKVVGADINALLIKAVNSGKKEAAAALIEFGGDINRRMADGRTLLMHAADDGEAEIAGMLVELGADADATDARKLTALMMATIKGHVKVVRRMRSLGVKN